MKSPDRSSGSSDHSTKAASSHDDHDMDDDPSFMKRKDFHKKQEAVFDAKEIAYLTRTEQIPERDECEGDLIDQQHQWPEDERITSKRRLCNSFTCSSIEKSEDIKHRMDG